MTEYLHRWGIWLFRRPDHFNTWGFISAHFCLSCCLTPPCAKMQSMACWDRFHTASRLRPNVEAASWYSWDKSVQKTPLSSVCNKHKYRSCELWLVNSCAYFFLFLNRFPHLGHNDWIKMSQLQNTTYTNHTRMSQLVPVLEVMIRVTGHGLPFDVWRQAQLFKKNKAWASHHWTEQKIHNDLGFT